PGVRPTHPATRAGELRVNCGRGRSRRVGVRGVVPVRVRVRLRVPVPGCSRPEPEPEAGSGAGRSEPAPGSGPGRWTGTGTGRGTPAPAPALAQARPGVRRLTNASQRERLNAMHTRAFYFAYFWFTYRPEGRGLEDARA